MSNYSWRLAWCRELQKRCLERSGQRVGGTFSTGRVAGDQISKSSRCQQRDKGGDHVLLTCRGGTRQGDPEVREGRRGSTALHGGAGGSASPAFPEPSDLRAKDRFFTGCPGKAAQHLGVRNATIPSSAAFSGLRCSPWLMH